MSVSDESSEILQRISRLEGRLEEGDRSLSKRVSLWGGLVALIISILIGGFQIFEYTILRQKEARDASIIQLGTFVRRISELNGDIARSTILADTPEKLTRANVEIKILNGEKLSVVRLADRLLQEYPDVGGFSTYATIAYEMLSQGNNPKALDYAQSALDSSETAPEKIEALGYIARVLFAPGGTQDIKAARKIFAKAKSLAQQESSYLRLQLTAGAISDLLVAEVLFGDCSEAIRAMSSLREELSAENSQLILQITLGEIGQNLRGNNKCPGIYL